MACVTDIPVSSTETWPIHAPCMAKPKSYSCLACLELVQPRPAVALFCWGEAEVDGVYRPVRASAIQRCPFLVPFCAGTSSTFVLLLGASLPNSFGSGTHPR